MSRLMLLWTGRELLSSDLVFISADSIVGLMTWLIYSTEA